MSQQQSDEDSHPTRHSASSVTKTTSTTIIDLRLIFGRSESDIKRIKGRIIGTEGKTRKLIEELTEADVVVYGHTVGIIGGF
jgi:rRNA processing protein Krr1/Pno1